jgi:hypothetical protein
MHSISNYPPIHCVPTRAQNPRTTIEQCSQTLKLLSAKQFVIVQSYGTHSMTMISDKVLVRQPLKHPRNVPRIEDEVFRRIDAETLILYFEVCILVHTGIVWNTKVELCERRTKVGNGSMNERPLYPYIIHFTFNSYQSVCRSTLKHHFTEIRKVSKCQ